MSAQEKGKTYITLWLIAFLFASDQRSHRIAVPLLLSQHAVKIDPHHCGAVPEASGLHEPHPQVSADASRPVPLYKQTLTLKSWKQISRQTISNLYVIPNTLPDVLNCLHAYPLPHWAYFSAFAAFSPSFLFFSSLSVSKSLFLPVLSRNTVWALRDSSSNSRKIGITCH